MNLKKRICTLGLAALVGAALPVSAAPSVTELAAYSGLSEQELNAAIAKARKQPVIIKTMTTPYESKPWWQYRKLFITTSRIQAGLQFYLQHADTLKRAEAELGVPPEIVCAIIGVETFYGRNGFEGVGQAKAVVFFIIVTGIAMAQLLFTRRKEVES